MNDITFDASDFVAKTNELVKTIERRKQQAVHDIASEILRLSSREVPLKTGALLNSGHVEDQTDESLVGYNKVYAARLHEHPEYHFNNGRKGKYLEDPIKNNIREFQKFINQILGGN